MTADATGDVRQSLWLVFLASLDRQTANWSHADHVLFDMQIAAAEVPEVLNHALREALIANGWGGEAVLYSRAMHGAAQRCNGAADRSAGLLRALPVARWPLRGPPTPLWRRCLSPD